ncbi:putative ribosomal protein s18 [Candidatus Carsonella ruddii HT isolate Thao2000]|uniref:Putative ribosomal protein s18 n=1 Tax=Candidatus Carsonella ruddii HT isolate Thao2000 TaxID=1202539 RepID=J3TW98_CARRU|nr:hypothetical protein [Candidatus Carsonella ruddii]AFP84100.1 putative ribosomal protein s18 [Candidatus Carsonella ruddii HT isolate Thao2000]
MKIYNLYIILKNIKKELKCGFLKSLISFFVRSEDNIISIIDFGNYFYNKKIKRLFYLKINCKKTNLKKIYKLLNIKKNIVYNYLIIKKNLNNYIIKFDIIKKFLNKRFKIIPSILINLKFKNHNFYSKIIKNLKQINLIPNNFISYIKKINYFYD